MADERALSDLSPQTPAWPDPLLADPHRQPDKARRIRQMFSAIAPAYDLNNRLHSLGLDQCWRQAAVRAAEPQPEETVLDVATGTADLALAFLRNGSRRVLAVDFSFPMLEMARRKIRRYTDSCVLLTADALRLPLADASVDVVGMAFGLRNLADPAVAVREFHRVLRPAGRLVILEFSLPTQPLIRRIYLFYFTHIFPRTAGLIARDRHQAYRYLVHSVPTFYEPPAICQLLRQSGFDSVENMPLTFGIVRLYRAVKV